MCWHEKHTLCITHRFWSQAEKKTSSQCLGLNVSLSTLSLVVDVPEQVRHQSSS